MYLLEIMKSLHVLMISKMKSFSSGILFSARYAQLRCCMNLVRNAFFSSHSSKEDSLGRNYRVSSVSHRLMHI